MTDAQLRDAILRHSLQILRLSAGEQQRAIAIMRELEAELRQLLERPLTGENKRTIEALISQAEKIIARGYGSLTGLIDANELAKLIAKQTSEIIGTALPVAVSSPAASTIAKIAADVLIQGSPASAWWSKQAEDTAFKFGAEVRQGVANGETTQRIVQRIIGKRGEPGIMDVARRNATALVNTQVATITSDARMESYAANSDIIKGFRRLTALDGHVCVLCAAYGDQTDGWSLEGKPLGKTSLPYRSGPFHFNDRCVEVPITKSFKELGIDLPDLAPSTRASSAGQVDAKTTFSDFLERQGRAFQDEVLGKGRADLWRAGRLTLRDLVSGTGRPLTLDQLRAL